MYTEPYLTVAAGLGITKEDVDSFVIKLKKLISLKLEKNKEC